MAHHIKWIRVSSVVYEFSSSAAKWHGEKNIISCGSKDTWTNCMNEGHAICSFCAIIFIRHSLIEMKGMIHLFRFNILLLC